MTLCDHVVNRLWDVIGNKPALGPTTLASVVAIDLAENEMQSFHQSRDYLITLTWGVVALYYSSLFFQVWQS